MNIATPLPLAPTLPFNALARAISLPRLSAYSREGDADSDDAVARYIWNLHICAALTPALHFLEIAFRNTLYRIGTKTTNKRFGASLCYTDISDCWLLSTIPDKRGGRQRVLAPREVELVAEAVQKLGRDTRRHTAGHLISHLSFGFWIRLCDAMYDQGNQDRPALWPDGAKMGFINCDDLPNRTRGGIRHAYGAMRDHRNLVAHHHPVWDCQPKEKHARAIQLLGWMNKPLAETVRATSTLNAVVDAGFGLYRPTAKAIMSIHRV